MNLNLNDHVHIFRLRSQVRFPKVLNEFEKAKYTRDPGHL